MIYDVICSLFVLIEKLAFQKTVVRVYYILKEQYAKQQGSDTVHNLLENEGKNTTPTILTKILL